MALRTLRLRLLLLAAAAGLATLLVPIAIGGDGDPGVPVCVHQRDGAMRLDQGGGCRQNEDSIRLADIGSLPAPRTAIVHAVREDIDLPDDDGSGSPGVVVHRLELTEPGAYVIVGKADFMSPTTGGTVACELVGRGDHMKFPVPGDLRATIPFMSDAFGPGAVELVCFDSPGADVVHDASRMVAIPVDDSEWTE